MPQSPLSAPCRTWHGTRFSAPVKAVKKLAGAKGRARNSPGSDWHLVASGPDLDPAPWNILEPSTQSATFKASKTIPTAVAVRLQSLGLLNHVFPVNQTGPLEPIGTLEPLDPATLGTLGTLGTGPAIHGIRSLGNRTNRFRFEQSDGQNPGLIASH